MPDTPEDFPGDLYLDSPGHGILLVGLDYGRERLEVHFEKVIAFRTHWDGDVLALEYPVPLSGIGEPGPQRMFGPNSPLSIIENSAWLNSGDFSVSLDYALWDHGPPLRHFRIISGACWMDVIARYEPAALWVLDEETHL